MINYKPERGERVEEVHIIKTFTQAVMQFINTETECRLWLMKDTKVKGAVLLLHRIIGDD